ncbi:MAG: hypothetical protein ACFFCW_25340 [Candidatus Hodarchaeota archaeon]
MKDNGEQGKRFAKRCVECVLFATHKCTQRRQRVPIIPENKIPVFDFGVPGTLRKYLDWFYSYDPIVIERYRWVAYPIFKTDVVCDDLIPFG